MVQSATIVLFPQLLSPIGRSYYNLIEWHCSFSFNTNLNFVIYERPADRLDNIMPHEATAMRRPQFCCLNKATTIRLPQYLLNNEVTSMCLPQ
jgi:hypothetical protein